MKKYYYLLPVFFLLFSATNSIFAQGQNNIWHFGRFAGFDFNGGGPAILAGGQLNSREGGATIANTAGSLLFYTDGITVWDKAHGIMPNGTGLMGDTSSTQSAIILQKPNSANIYYIFTSGSRGNASGVTYSEVDLTLNGGFGDLTATKNIQLNTPTCEKLTAVRHCNQRDIWVISHDWGSNAFRTYLVTPAGVTLVPVISNVGLVPVGNTASAIDQLPAIIRRFACYGNAMRMTFSDACIGNFNEFRFLQSGYIFSSAIAHSGF